MVPLDNVMRCLTGRMVMSFVSMKGVPARISTSRFSTTRPLNVNVLLSRVSEIDTRFANNG